MLATLALEPNRVISRQQLAEELWPGEDVGNSTNALQVQATRVRKILEEPGGPPGSTLLRSVRGGYVLSLPADRIDAHAFLALASEGAAALSDEPERARGLLEAALSLWRGPALLDASDGMRCRSAANLYEERRLTVREHLAAASLALGDEPRAVADLQQLLAQHPLNERFCELLMIALYRCGRQGDALHLFRSMQQRLDEELGVQPGLALRTRHREILCQHPSLARTRLGWTQYGASDRGQLLSA